MQRAAQGDAGIGLIEQGVALFNERKFWHAHEAWEQLWLEAAGDEKQFLQGLIQLAAAYHHVQRGTSPRGAVRLFDAALRRLAPFADGHDGVAFESALRAAERHRERIAQEGKIADVDYPNLHLVTR